jgi:hypothetical protein
MPAPTSTYTLRRHLADDHGDDRRGAAWADLEVLHDHAHSHEGTGHTHDPAPVKPKGPR